jgi:hypothetical protein
MWNLLMRVLRARYLFRAVRGANWGSLLFMLVMWLINRRGRR